MLDLAIRGGTVVTSTDTFAGDIGVRDGKIAIVADRIPSGQAAQELDANGLLVLPGVIDADTHFQFISQGCASVDDFAGGSKAAAFGGVTTCIDTVVPEPGQPFLHALEERLKQAARQFCVDYSFHGGLGDNTEVLLQSLPTLVARGIPSVLASTMEWGEERIATDSDILTLLDRTRMCGALLGLRAENRSLVEYFSQKFLAGGARTPLHFRRSRPAFSEVEAIRRAAFYAELVEGRLFFFQLSTAEATRAVGEAKGRGLLAFASTCPYYLLLTDDLYREEDAPLYLTAPPLRGTADVEGLWKGIRNGTVQVISSGHRAWRRQDKARGRDDFSVVPMGLPGVETLLPLIFSEGVRPGRISLNQMVELLCANPARLFGLHPHKGNLVPGADADVVLLDPKKAMRLSADCLHMQCDWSPFENWEVHGWPVATLLRGRTVVREGEFLGRAGEGTFLERGYDAPDAQRVGEPMAASSTDVKE